MKTRTKLIDGVERQIIIYRWAEWPGFEGSDDIIEMTPERKVFRRNNSLIIVDDAEHDRLPK